MVIGQLTGYIRVETFGNARWQRLTTSELFLDARWQSLGLAVLAVVFLEYLEDGVLIFVIVLVVVTLPVVFYLLLPLFVIVVFVRLAFVFALLLAISQAVVLFVFEVRLDVKTQCQNCSAQQNSAQ